MLRIQKGVSPPAFCSEEYETHPVTVILNEAGEVRRN